MQNNIWEKYKFIIIKTSIKQLERVHGSIYNATRRDWKINPDRAIQYPYVLSVINKKVVEVYKVKNWYLSAPEQNRYAFNGVVAEKEVRDTFINKIIPNKFTKRHMRAPVLYCDKKE